MVLASVTGAFVSCGAEDVQALQPEEDLARVPLPILNIAYYVGLGFDPIIRVTLLGFA